MNFFSQMWQRMTTADTPKFFKKIQVMGASIGALGLSFTKIAAVSSSAGYLITAGAIMVAVGQMACTDAPNTNSPQKP